MEYSPKPSVVVERTIPVAAFFASTLAPATTAPVASFTVPTRVAVEICAEAVKAKANTITATGTAIRIDIPLSVERLYHGVPPAANLVQPRVPAELVFNRKRVNEAV